VPELRGEDVSARVVDPHVDAAVCRPGSFGQCGELRPVSEIQRQDLDLPAQGADIGFRFVRATPVPAIGDHQVCAGPRARERDGPADPARRSGDQHRALRESPVAPRPG